MSPAIEVNQLGKTYRTGFIRRRSVPALADVSFAVDAGSIFGLLGPNGAGKTTLIKILLGLVRPTTGQATLLAHPAGSRHGRAQVGYLPEHHRMPGHLTGNSALTYYGGLSGLAPREVRRRRPAILRQVGLEDWGEMPVRKYSKGMQQRLGLAQAMLHNPPLLILDEPTDGVDPVGRREMRSVLQSLKDDGKTIFVNSHLLQEVELVCDRVAILVHGTLRQVGPITELTNREATEVEFTLVGAESEIREALSEAVITAWEVDQGNQIRCTITATDQAIVNQCVDQLRARRIDLLAVTPRRDSLEEAFLNIVNDTNDPL